MSTSKSKTTSRTTHELRAKWLFCTESDSPEISTAPPSADVLRFPQPLKSTEFPNRSVGRPTDIAQGRTRSHLTPTEVEAMIKAAKSVGVCSGYV